MLFRGMNDLAMDIMGRTTICQSDFDHQDAAVLSESVHKTMATTYSINAREDRM
jgi:hypothetical protein